MAKITVTIAKLKRKFTACARVAQPPNIGAHHLPNAARAALAISDTFVVASQAAQLALSGADVGDVAVRTDLNKSYILRVAPASTFANWQELLTPTDAVTSVNGQTGVVNVGTVTSNDEKREKHLVLISAVTQNYFTADELKLFKA